jgi:hypothetical protein
MINKKTETKVKTGSTPLDTAHHYAVDAVRPFHIDVSKRRSPT